MDLRILEIAYNTENNKTIEDPNDPAMNKPKALL